MIYFLHRGNYSKHLQVLDIRFSTEGTVTVDKMICKGLNNVIQVEMFQETEERLRGRPVAPSQALSNHSMEVQLQHTAADVAGSKVMLGLYVS